MLLCLLVTLLLLLLLLPQGRKKTMMFGGICFLIGAILLATAFSWTQLVIGRLVLGLGVGLATMATPFYMNEMTPPQWRGECVVKGEEGDGKGIGRSVCASACLGTWTLDMQAL